MKRLPGTNRRTMAGRPAGRVLKKTRPAPSDAQPAPPSSIAEHRTARASQAVQAAQAAVSADQAVGQGVPLHQAGRLAEAEACYRQALALVPAHPEALHLLGLL